MIRLFQAVDERTTLHRDLAKIFGHAPIRLNQPRMHVELQRHAITQVQLDVHDVERLRDEPFVLRLGGAEELAVLCPSRCASAHSRTG